MVSLDENVFNADERNRNIQFMNLDWLTVEYVNALYNENLLDEKKKNKFWKNIINKL